MWNKNCQCFVMPLTISIGTNPRKRKLFIWNQNCYCYVWQKEADIANKSGKQMRSISFQGMLDWCTTVQICNMHWLVVNTNIYKYANCNAHWMVLCRIFSLFTLATLWFHSRVRLISVQTSQSQRALIAGLSDILLFSLWQPFGAGNENMICLADDSWCTIFEMRNGGKTKRRGDKKKNI